MPPSHNKAFKCLYAICVGEITVCGCIFTQKQVSWYPQHVLSSSVGSDVNVLGLMLRCHLLCSLDRRSLPDPGVRALHGPFHLKLLPLHDLEDTQHI